MDGIPYKTANGETHKFDTKEADCLFEEEVEYTGSSASGTNNGSLINFIDRLENKINDKRLNFLFGENSKKISFEETLCELLGYQENAKANITILDLSGVPFDVLSITVSLISRILFEFGYYYKRMRTENGVEENDVANDIPLLLVYEEAHKYVPSESDMVDAENIENNASTQHLEAPVNVIYQTAEDGLGDTIKPRLLAAGADCTKVMVIDDSEQPLTMADVRLEEAIVQTKARMVVLDPIQGFLGSEVDMHRANEIRPLMKRIAVLAEKYHCAIILIGHMNKNSNGKSSYRGLGSIDFQAAARSVLIVGRIKDEPEVRVVCHTKSSLAPEGKAIAFRLDKNNGFEWIGEYDISADELLNGEGKGQKTRKAKEFLLEILADGGMAQKKIEEEAEKLGIKKKTLRNAKMELGIDSVKRGNQWYWMLSE